MKEHGKEQKKKNSEGKGKEAEKVEKIPQSDPSVLEINVFDTVKSKAVGPGQL